MAQKTKSLKRGAGVLLAVSSLPSPYGIGTLGGEAFRFLDFLHRAGQSYWQVLPIGPTSYGDSPYQSFSAFAGNPYYIDLDFLAKEGLLEQTEIEAYDWGAHADETDYAKIYESRFLVLHQAFARSKHEAAPEFQKFCGENRFWLDDYCLYMALKFQFEGHEWLLWPEELRLREEKALLSWKKKLAEETAFWAFCQFKFYEQWHAVKSYANRLGIQIIGDIPIYVAMDSADVWVNSNLFQMDENRRPTHVAGVPPDLFSKTGQLWGNPLYDWDAMEKTDFAWWRSRMKMSAQIYDVIRIDHFIGVVRFYSIPAGEDTAMNGEYLEGPGEKLIRVIDESVGESKVIAEDLGLVVPSVRKLLRKSGYPGMKVLLFAFDSGSSNDHLPIHHTANTVVYGGTHDNETVVQHCDALSRKELRFMKDYLNTNRRGELPKAVLRAGYASVADTAVFQMQDVLFLPGSARMNFPSTLGGNWQWRLQKGQADEKSAQMLYSLCETYGRLPEKKEKTAGKGAKKK